MTPLIGATIFFYDMLQLHFLTPFDTPCYQHVYRRHTDKTDGEVESSVHWPWKHVSFTSDKATIRLQIPMLGRQKPTTPTPSVRHIEDSMRHFRYSIVIFLRMSACWTFTSHRGSTVGLHQITSH